MPAGGGGGSAPRKRGPQCPPAPGPQPLDPLRRFVLFLESFAPLVNSLNLGIASPFLLGPPPLQLAQIKTQLALQQLTSLVTSSSAPPNAWFNQALLKSTMFSPRGTLPQRPRGPNPSGTKPPGSFPGGGAGGLQRKPASGTPQGAPPRFSGQDTFQWTGSQRINVRVTLHRADPRQVKEKTNHHQEQKGEPRPSCWDGNPRPAVTSGQKPPAPARGSEQNPPSQNRYTPESASSILASFGLSNEDLEELSRYPDEQLTPENMPLILREIRMRKMGHSSARPHAAGRAEEALGSGASGAGVKSKVIDYGHASKYGYTEDPLEVHGYSPKVLPAEPLEARGYNPEAPGGEKREDFQREQNVSIAVPSSTQCNPVFPVEELIKPTGFQNDSSSTPPFFPAEAPGKVSGLCVAPAGLTVVTSIAQPAVPPVMPPPMVPPVSQPAVLPVMPPPMVPPVSQPAVPPVMPPMMPPVSQPAMPPVMPPVLPPVSQPAVPPVMPPMMPPMITPLAPMLAPVMLTFVQQSMTQHVMPPITQPPFTPELLVSVSQHERLQQEAGSSQPTPPSAPAPGQKPFQPKAEGPIKSPFGIVKASWLPAFLQPDSQKTKRLPTPSMMNDYYATSPRIFPHMCSLCNIECTHMKDWILHQNTSSHIESCRQLRQQYPDWNPETHSSKRNAADRKENQTPKRRSSSASPSPRRSRFSSYGPRRSRSRSRSPGRFRPRPRSRSPRPVRRLSLRHRSRSPQRSRNPLRSNPRPQRSSSHDWSSRRPSRSQDRKSALEAVVKSLGPGFVAEFNKHRSAGQGSSGSGRSSPSHGSSGKKPGSTKKPLKTSGSVKASKKEGSGSSSPETDDSSQNKEAEENEEDPTGTSGPRPAPYNRLLRKELLSCGTVLQISDLPDDGFSDQDIKKIVQPFGKVSDFLVLRSKNMAFLEMNYKEAVIAAVKYGKTTPVLINGKRVKISVAEKPKPAPAQAKTSIKKKTPTIKKVAPSTKKDKKTTTTKTAKSIAGKKEKIKKLIKTGVSKVKKTSDTAAAKSVDAELQISAETEMDMEGTKVSDPKSVAEGDSAPEPGKTEETEPQGVTSPTPLPEKLGEVPEAAACDVDECKEPFTEQEAPVATLKSEEPPEPANQEPDDGCVVVVSNLPEKGYSVEEVSNLAKPFGGPRDVLILSSHKKAYMEINRKSADSMVKFYTCFPMSVDGNQLCISLLPQYKTIKDEVNTETLHNQFVHLGNLPADGYRELEVLCVGLRFGKVDHYVVLKNKNKAILQLDSPKSAHSMYTFLKQYPYTMGEHTLTCGLSPHGEAAEAEPVEKEVKQEEPGQGSSGLKKYPEGSGVVQRAAANPPVEPSVAQRGPVPISHVKDEMSAEQTEPSEPQLERVGRESPAETAVEKVNPGAGAAVVSIQGTPPRASPGKSEAILPPPASGEGEEALKDPAGPELLEPAAVAASEKEIKEEEEEEEEVSAPAVEAAQEVSAVGKAEEEPSDCAVKPAAGEPTGAVPEPLSPAAAAGKVVSPVVTPVSKLEAPEHHPVPEAVKTTHETPATQIAEKKPVLTAGAALEKKLDEAEAEPEVKPEESATHKAGRAAEEDPEKLLVKTGAEAEKKLENTVAKVGVAVENTTSAGSESSEGGAISTHQTKGRGAAKPDEPQQAVTFSSSFSVKEYSSLSKTFLKAVVSLQDISKTRFPLRRNEPSPCKAGEQKAPAKPESQGQAVEKKVSPKEEDPPQPGGSQANPGDGGGKCKVSRSSVVGGKGGNGRNSSLQEKESRVETRASSKLSQEGESRSCSMKTETSSNKASVGGSAKTSKSGISSSAKQKEEEELFPFNLDEFVTVDEVVEETESPVKTRRNPPRGKRKDGAKPNPSSEPGSKRRKGKSPGAARLAESQLSFVTLDEVGEGEEVTAQLMAVANLEALSDPQGLVVVDEVMEEEELLAEAVKDPQSLVTLDELSEQEELRPPRHLPGCVFEEADLKAEPLVTVDEIGEVEELPLNEPTELSLEEVLKQKEDEKVGAEDAGDGGSSQAPDDPSALVTVDEIQEDNEENPLLTLDEVNEDEDDFLADFNRLKEELNFVTVDEVGEEDEEEENTCLEKNLDEDEGTEDVVAIAGPEEEDIGGVAGPEEEDIVAVAGPEEMEILGEMGPEEDIIATSKSKVAQLGSGDKDPEAKRKKTSPSDAAKPLSTPKDLDYLVPKAGFFCQICSLFYADETSVKNHCKTPLHQQNMEKFMAQQEAEEKEGEERSSR
ncbi:zinc finger protein 638 isoform X3 [Calypte anna]|uniref:zinc finger protein 638 isoform X3 n=1 Tax=Calypte anna TaxID=9244 RepID=UPI0011C430FA|nr:zinc finger protein 638 isoform X3 [Calypte anna]